MLLTQPFWIATGRPGRLGVMPRPRGGEWLKDEIKGLKSAGVDAVLCLLQPDEIAELGLEAEKRLCEANGIAYLGFPVPNRGVPANAAAFKVVALDIADRLRAGMSVAVHCRAGIGRSSLAAACVMVELGFKGDKAFTLIAQARGLPVPDTGLQRDWIREFEADRAFWPAGKA